MQPIPLMGDGSHTTKRKFIYGAYRRACLRRISINGLNILMGVT